MRECCRTKLIFAAGAALLATGCAMESPLSVHRFWADWNTYRAPAIVYDRITHQPMKSHRVNELRWMYNLGPHDVDRQGLLPRYRTPVRKPPVELPIIPPLPQPSPKSNPLVPPAPSSDQSPPPSESSSPIASDNEPPAVPRTARSDAWRFAR